MKSHLNWEKAQKLEQIFHQSSQSKSSPSQRSLGAKLNDVWQGAIAHLELASEPHVWKTQDQLGRVAWSAYAAATRQSIQQVSAQEMRAWLEEQHYQDTLIAHQNAQQFQARKLLRSF
ncbi:MAG TPA: hypothetical protein V6C57_18820 [Coleofasciculaceae cyanobacterium]